MSRSSQSTSRPCHCLDFRQRLRLGDSFRCGDCDSCDTSGPTQLTNDQATEGSSASDTTHLPGSAQVRAIFSQITGRQAATQLSSSQQQERDHVPLGLQAAARGEVLATFSLGGKAAEYHKLACGPTQANVGLRKVGLFICLTVY
jgi:hypothetical protein